MTAPGSGTGRDWSPFRLAPPGAHAEAPRSIRTREGVADRLRAAAFAEIQAREAFLWAADHFAEATPELQRAWRALAASEQRHLDWLLTRMAALGFEVGERQVSDFLWQSFMGCTSAREFAHFMANAEERGRKAGERFHEQLRESDPESARIFGQIALEEVAHITLAERFFPSERVAGPDLTVGTPSALA